MTEKMVKINLNSEVKCSVFRHFYKTHHSRFHAFETRSFRAATIYEYGVYVTKCPPAVCIVGFLILLTYFEVHCYIPNGLALPMQMADS